MSYACNTSARIVVGIVAIFLLKYLPSCLQRDATGRDRSIRQYTPVGDRLSTAGSWLILMSAGASPVLVATSALSICLQHRGDASRQPLKLEPSNHSGLLPPLAFTVVLK